MAGKVSVASEIEFNAVLRKPDHNNGYKNRRLKYTIGSLLPPWNFMLGWQWNTTQSATCYSLGSNAHYKHICVIVCTSEFLGWFFGEDSRSSITHSFGLNYQHSQWILTFFYFWYCADIWLHKLMKSWTLLSGVPSSISAATIIGSFYMPDFL